ncbi:MAG: ATP-binding protein [Clostridia bacterium]|nr:ATP-binding protein [Clostridia bacterium]
MKSTTQYFLEQYKQSYAKSADAKNRGEYAESARLMKESAYYLTQANADFTGTEKETNDERIKRMLEISESLLLKVQEAKKTAAKSGPNAGGQPHSSSSSGTSESGGKSFYSIVDASDIDVTFDDVIGLELAKKTVTDYVINPKLYPDKYNYNFMQNKGILLEGPPGTGKTTFAKAVAREVRQPFALVNVSTLVDCYVGETSKHIDELFAVLRDYATENRCGVTIFFDEFDEIAKKRGSEDKASENAVPALLRNLDGVITNNDFLLIANTNCVDMLDPAILSRFRRRINIPLPGYEGRLSLFKSKSRDIEEEITSQIDWDRMVGLSEGMSGRDIAYICDDFKYELGGMKAGLTESADVSDILAECVERRRFS